EDHPVARPASPGRADHRLLDAGGCDEHPGRGRPVVPRSRDPAADRELGQSAGHRAGLLPDPAVADGLARGRRAVRDACVQSARRRSARRLRPAVVRLASAVLGGRTAVLLVAAAAALGAWPVAGAGAGSDVARARTVQIVFTGKGGGRYLDHTRWLHEVTRQCYASRLADETLSVRWRIEWTARLVPGAKGYLLRSTARRTDAIAGSVKGTTVQDNCDSAEEEPGWAGTSTCESDLELHTNGDLGVARTAGGLRLGLRGPKYRSPGHPCELDIRNDQLV